MLGNMWFKKHVDIGWVRVVLIENTKKTNAMNLNQHKVALSWLLNVLLCDTIYINRWDIPPQMCYVFNLLSTFLWR